MRILCSALLALLIVGFAGNAGGFADDTPQAAPATDDVQLVPPDAPTKTAATVPPGQFAYVRIAASVACVILLITVIDLVRRRKLRIEYSWLWILTTSSMLLLAVWYDLLIAITRTIFLRGPDDPVSPRESLYLFGFMFLLCICLHYSVKISQLTDQVKILVQELSLHRSGVDDRPPTDEIKKTDKTRTQ